MASHTPTQRSAELQPIARELARLMNDASARVFHDVAEGGDAPPALEVERAAQARGPQQLAASHKGPVQQREAVALYRRCLAHYRDVIQAGRARDGGLDDLGHAAAYFVVANLAALQDLDPGEDVLAPVAAQLCRLIVGTAAWQRAPLAERQAWFEQLAVLGVLVNESRIQARVQGAAAVANVRRAARGYIVQLLGLDPQRLVLTPQGLGAATAVH